MNYSNVAVLLVVGLFMGILTLLALGIVWGFGISRERRTRHAAVGARSKPQSLD